MRPRRDYRKLVWAELTPGKIQYLVRVLARQSKAGEGARSAEYMCDMLYGVAGWLRQEELIPQTAAIPKRFWKVRLKQEWQALTGRKVEPRRPRHSLDEMTALFKALPTADPRLRLLIELAAELRAGQAVRATRSDLVLGPVGGFELGRFVVQGRVKKHGLRRQSTDLAPEFVQDARVLNRLTGHLDSSTRERIYQDPQNELVRGRAAVPGG